MKWGVETIQVNFKGTEFKVVRFRYSDDLEKWIAEYPDKRRPLQYQEIFDRKLKHKARAVGGAIGCPVRVIVRKDGSYA